MVIQCLHAHSYFSKKSRCNRQVRAHYRAVPYHNFFHVVDVTHAAFRFIRLAGGRARMSPAEKLALMVAALCHDMDHPGRHQERTHQRWISQTLKKPTPCKP